MSSLCLSMDLLLLLETLQTKTFSVNKAEETDPITVYIHVCLDSIIPTRTKRCSTNKAWTELKEEPDQGGAERAESEAEVD